MDPDRSPTSSIAPTPRVGRAGFSLAELLVVIGILSLLIALLLPALNKSRRKARALACKAQLHDLGVSMQMYLNQNKGRYPLAPQLPSVNPAGYETIMALLKPHSGPSGKVFSCPSDEVVFPAEGTSYFYYSELGITPLTQTFLYKVFKTPSAVPVLWDADNYHGGSVPFNWLFADGHVDEFLDATAP